MQKKIRTKMPTKVLLMLSTNKTDYCYEKKHKGYN